MKTKLLIAMLFLLGMAANAEEQTREVTVEGIVYTLQTGTATVKAPLDKLITEANIAQSVNYRGGTYLVTEVGRGAFDSCNNLNTVNLPEGLTTIGESAFIYCSELRTITLPESLRTLGVRTFSFCENLNYIEVSPRNAYFCSVDGVLFNKQKSILYLCPPDSQYGSYSIPSGITEIGDYAFSCCKRLTSITLPDRLIKIGDFAFEYCSKLTTFTLPATVRKIGDLAFRDCSGLTSIEVASENTSFASFDGVLFNRDKTVLCVYPAARSNSYILPAGVKKIGDYAFAECSELTSITLSDGLKEIGALAFFNCSSLLSIDFPVGMQQIGGTAFGGCYRLTSLTIPGTITTLDPAAFENCAGLVSVIILEGVREIGDSTFSFCTNLTSVTLPASLTRMEDYAFGFCEKLPSIDIPAGVTEIKGGAFTRCKSMTDVYVRAMIPPIIEPAIRSTPSTFDVETYTSTTLHVPAGRLSVYQTADEWKEFTNMVEENYSSIVTPADCSRIIGASIYTLSGTKIRTLMAEEVQTDDVALILKYGIYLLVVQTELGTETRKIIVTE